MLGSAGDARTLAEFRKVVCKSLRQLVPCDLAGYNEVSLEDGSITVTTDPSDKPFATGPQAFARYMHQHPVMAAHRRGEVGAASISDFLTESQFHQLDLYRRVYGPMEIADQLSFTLDATETEISAIALNRSSWGFADRERRLLDLITPNLAQARRQVLAREEDERVLAAAVGSVESLGIGLITLDAEDAPATWSPIAGRLVRENFGAELGSELPPAIAAWLERDRAGTPLPPLTAGGEGRSVSITLVGGQQGGALLVREHHRAAAENLKSLGLTQRRAEVLAALMEGDTNDEIARRLELSPRTVQKHVAHLLATLGVHTRTAAAARAREALEGA